MFKNFKFGAGHTLIAIGGGSVVVSAGLNVAHSLHIALWAVPIILLSEGARLGIPFIAAERGWTKHLKVTFGAVVVLCLLTTTAFLADKFASVIRERGHIEAVQAQKVEKIADLKAAIEKFQEQRSSESLKALAAGEAKNEFCGPKCLKWLDLAATAERREKLETELADLVTQTQTTAPVQVSGLGLLIGTVTGLGTQTGSAISMIAVAAAILYSLDLLVYLIIPGATYLRQDRQTARIAAFTGDFQAPKSKTGKVGKDEAYHLLVSYLLAQPDGATLTSRRQLCRVILGTDSRKTTFNDWMNSWIAKGDLLAVTKDKKKELISLPKAA